MDVDGKIRWLSLRGLPLLNESAQVHLVRGTAMDVTERKRAELRRTLEHNVTRRLAEADTLAAVTPRIIEAICLTMGWDCGARRSWDAGSACFACHETWSADSAGPQAFIAHTDGATLLKHADIAMYRAKEQGKNNVNFYTPATYTHSVQRLVLKPGLRRERRPVQQGQA
jgi:GGDEF domain-containing protein